MRWVDSDLNPRTLWWPIDSWDYSYNIDDKVLVDPSGKALVLIYFDPPMSMPCPGDMSLNAWVSEDGSIAPLQTSPPSFTTQLCDDPQGGSYGSPLALGDGFAFYFPKLPDAPVSGWWAYFRAGQTKSEQPPAWLQRYGSDLIRLSNGNYLSVERDATSCARTAELIGPVGQLCATLALDESADCNASDQLWPDGSVTLADGCAVRWWPGLAR